MKRYNNLYEKIYNIENLRNAHSHAKKGKGWYREVKEVDRNLDYYLHQLQNMLIDKTYKTSEYEIFIKNDNGKEREIFKLPYFPDRICQWAIVQIIEPILISNFTRDTYSAIPKRGIHKCLNQVTKDIKRDVENTVYCLKLDVKKYYPSINHQILKDKYKKIFKDKNLSWLLGEIIDSTEGETGIPIGNYLSQYSGNFYLSEFDHWLKECKHVKYCYRYMDDVVIFNKDKDKLHRLRKDIEIYFKNELKLTLKDNWQVFPTNVRGVDFVGYRIFNDYKLLRKSTCKNFKRKMIKIKQKIDRELPITYSEWCSFNSYKGWLMPCDSYRLGLKYLSPIKDDMKKFYLKKVKKG